MAEMIDLHADPFEPYRRSMVPSNRSRDKLLQERAAREHMLVMIAEAANLLLIELSVHGGVRKRTVDALGERIMRWRQAGGNFPPEPTL